VVTIFDRYLLLNITVFDKEQLQKVFGLKGNTNRDMKDSWNINAIEG